ncbi:MAG TPA: hypothetical protein VH186_00090 [Chloroflexia bacterium]|nr:hypothetical protein [Chloroflexia bacterium]
MSISLLEGISLPQVISQMNEWLLKSEIQLSHGPEAGGIAGWLTEQDLPEYVYMEITGYYLSSMAFIADKTESSTTRDLALDRANRALDWLYSYVSRQELPPTRKYIAEPGGGDWRNTALFAFDIGMVVRGLCDIRPYLSGPKHYKIMQYLLTRLSDYITQDYSLRPLILSDPNHILPVKWSTTHGPYHLKVVSAVFSLPPELVTANLRKLAHNVYSTWSEYCDEVEITEDLHPTLYYLEGMVQFALNNYEYNSLDKIAKLFTKILSYQMMDGSLPYNPVSAQSVLRADVQFQALRMGAILLNFGYFHEPEWSDKLNRLCLAAMRFVGDSGAVSFHPIDPAHPQHWNAWCTMFAQQALSYYNDVVNGKSLTEQELSQIV